MSSEPSQRIDKELLKGFSARESGGRQDPWSELELRCLVTDLRVELGASYGQIQDMRRLRALLFAEASTQELVDLRHAASSAAGAWWARARERGLAILVASGEGELKFRADPGLVAGALDGLLADAVESGRPGGVIRLELREDSDGVAAIASGVPDGPTFTVRLPAAGEPRR